MAALERVRTGASRRSGLCQSEIGVLSFAGKVSFPLACPPQLPSLSPVRIHAFSRSADWIAGNPPPTRRVEPVM